MATKKSMPFHKTAKDKESKRYKEGSKREEAMDRKQGEKPDKRKGC
jgi:hypothetical protein